MLRHPKAAFPLSTSKLVLRAEVAAAGGTNLVDLTTINGLDRTTSGPIPGVRQGTVVDERQETVHLVVGDLQRSCSEVPLNDFVTGRSSQASVVVHNARLRSNEIIQGERVVPDNGGANVPFLHAATNGFPSIQQFFKGSVHVVSIPCNEKSYYGGLQRMVLSAR